jgi:hypothetical protein
MSLLWYVPCEKKGLVWEIVLHQALHQRLHMGKVVQNSQPLSTFTDFELLGPELLGDLKTGSTPQQAVEAHRVVRC